MVCQNITAQQIRICELTDQTSILFECSVKIVPQMQFNFVGKTFSLSFLILFTDLLCQIGSVTWLKLMTFSYLCFLPNKAKCEQITQDASTRHQSVLMSTFYLWSVVGLWRKRVQERNPDIVLPNDTFQLFLGDPKVFPNQRGYIIPLPSSGSAWGLFPSSSNPSVSKKMFSFQ